MLINYFYKRLFLIIFFIGIVSACFAQNEQIDSQRVHNNDPTKAHKKKKKKNKKNADTTINIMGVDSSAIKKHKYKKTSKHHKKKLAVDTTAVSIADEIPDDDDSDDDSDYSPLAIPDSLNNFKKIISLKIADSIIQGDLAFPSYTISRLNSLHTKINKKAVFSSTHFTGPVRFNDVEFLDEAQFMDAKFDDVIRFGKTKFRKMTGFTGAVFSQDAFFDDVKFLGYVKFDKSTFLKKAEFNNANFSGLTNFSYVRFKEQCSMTHLETNENTEIRFRNTVFPDTVIFSYNFNNTKEIDFTTADFTDSCRFDYTADSVKPIYIFLYKTDISKLHLDYVHFKLLVPDSTVHVPKKRKFISIDEKESMYEALLANFKAHGQQESYKLCDIEYQTFRWKHGWAKWFVWLPKWWWNFGYDRQLIFSRTLLLLGIFTLITYFFIYYLNEEVYHLENIATDKRWAKKVSLQDFWNRLWYSLIYTASIFFKLTLQVDKVNFKKKIGTSYLILIFVIGLVCLAYMANFVIQK